MQHCEGQEKLKASARPDSNMPDMPGAGTAGARDDPEFKTPLQNLSNKAGFKSLQRITELAIQQVEGEVNLMAANEETLKLGNESTCNQELRRKHKQLNKPEEDSKRSASNTCTHRE